MPDTVCNALVYSLTNGTFNRNSNFMVADASNLSGGTRAANTTFILRRMPHPSGNADFQIYPSSNLYDGRGIQSFKTKRYSVAGANGKLMMFLLRRIKIDYVLDGYPLSGDIRVYNDRMASGNTTVVLGSLSPGRWKGLPRNLKGYYFEIEFEGGTEIKDIEVDLIIYGN